MGASSIDLFVIKTGICYVKTSILWYMFLYFNKHEKVKLHRKLNMREFKLVFGDNHWYPGNKNN